MARLRIGVVGAGVIGRQHIRRIAASGDCTLAAITDPDPRTALLAAELQVPHFGNVEAMLAATLPDGVIVASPNSDHAPSALACVARRIPVLVEKPIADTLANGARIADAAEAAGVAVLVGHHRRHSPTQARACEIVASGRLGRIATVTALVTFLKPEGYFDAAWRREPGGGPILINLIHAIDDMRTLCGEIVALGAFTGSALRGFPVEDSAVINLRFASGALGTITLSDAAAAPWSWELTSGEDAAFGHVPEDCYLIAGTEGSLALPSLRLWHYGKNRGWNAPLILAREAPASGDPLVRQLAHFVEVIRGEVAPLVSPRDALRTLDVTLAVHEAAARGSTITLAGNSQ